MAPTRVASFEEGWGILSEFGRRVIDTVEGRLDSPIDRADFMRCYEICIQLKDWDTGYSPDKQGPLTYDGQLYQGWQDIFTTHLRDQVAPGLTREHDDVVLLREVSQAWQNQQRTTKNLGFVFRYLDKDRDFSQQLQDKPSIRVAAHLCFRDQLFERDKNRIRDALLAVIGRRRKGEQTEEGEVKNAVDLFACMGDDVYETELEGPFLTESAAVYARQAEAWIQENTCSEYAIRAEQCLEKEADLAKACLRASTLPKLLSTVRREVVYSKAQELLQKDSGLTFLLLHEKKEDLRRLCTLFFADPEGLNLMAQGFYKYMESAGLELCLKMEDAIAQAKADKRDLKEQEQEFVHSVSGLLTKGLIWVKDCFCDQEAFHQVLKQAFENMLNKHMSGDKVAEILANFVDHLMKRAAAGRAGDDEDFDTDSDKVVRLLEYVEGKDVFADLARRKLARRLIVDKQESQFEKELLSKLKMKFGSGIIHKMDCMVKDMALASEQQAEFAEEMQRRTEGRPPLDLSVTVLTGGSWPTYKPSGLLLPEEMATCVAVFTDYYGQKNPKKKLTWVFSLGQCTVTGNFAAKTIDLILSTYQGALLMLFNSSEALSFSDVKQQLGLPSEEVARLLHSVACGKHKILLKAPKEAKTVSSSDSFSFNAQFTDKHSRIKIPLPQVEDRQKALEQVDKDRVYAIDAAIVRIMKSRKKLDKNTLEVEVVKQLLRTFRPDAKTIKKRIDDLIGRDYISRDPDNNSIFHYVA